MSLLPALFLERLKDIVPENSFEVVLASFQQEKDVVIRWNSLRPDKGEFLAWLDQQQVRHKPIAWYSDAYIIPGEKREALVRSPWMDNGSVYLQNISSLFVPVVLQPQPGETILDLCAAPGSKLSQVAMMTNDEADLTGIEPVRKRFYRLQSVLRLLGVQNARLHMQDGRKWKHPYPADKVLVDAPCSSEGRFQLANKKSVRYWSLRKIKEMRHKQKGLLLNASRQLKPGGRLVYSTCTFAPEENEGVVSWFMKKTRGLFSLAPVDTYQLERYPPLTAWQGRTFEPGLQHCVRLLPNTVADAFFIAHFIKKG